MRKHHFLTETASLLTLIGAAVGAASATEQHRVPAARHLERLGIDKAAFEAIRR